MKKIVSAIILIATVATLQAQTKPQQGHEVKVTIKGIKDSVCYLTIYRWEGQYYADTAVVKKGGTMVFKGNKPLEKGLYSIVGGKKNALYFDLPVTEQKFSIVTDTADIYKNMKSQIRCSSSGLYSSKRLEQNGFEELKRSLS